MEEEKPTVEIYNTPGIGTYYIKDGMIHNIEALSCPRCKIGYIQPIPIDVTTAGLLRTHGKWRCNRCDYIAKKDPVTER